MIEIGAFNKLSTHTNDPKTTCWSSLPASWLRRLNAYDEWDTWGAGLNQSLHDRM